MIESYLSDVLKKIEKELKELNDLVSKNQEAIKEAGVNVKELQSKIDPSLEVFSPLKINTNIKKNIQQENHKIDTLNKEIADAKDKIEKLTEDRMNTVAMLAGYREDKYKLEKYQSMDITRLLNTLRTNLENSLNNNHIEELHRINKDNLKLIDKYIKP